MITKRKQWVALVACCVFAVASVRAAAGFEESTAARLREATGGLTPGVAVLVARDGKILFQEGYGYADVARKKRITPQTKFRIGSITKQFTAAAILRLADSGKLSLDDPLERYFAGFPRGASITLRQLLTHTSGLHSYTDKAEFLGRVGERIEPAELIAWFRDDPADFAPGAGFQYSNSAYFLLGEIVAKVSGTTLAAHLRHELFEPLGMKDTDIYVNADPPPSMARGYAAVNGKIEPALDWDMSWAGGAGALYSTVGDLFRWNEALFGGRVLGPATLAAATTPVTLPENVDGMRYGYGLMMYDLKGLPAVGHGGGLNGWSSSLLRLPRQNTTVVVLANAMPEPPGLAPGEIAHALAASLLAGEVAALPPPATDDSVDPATFTAYAGRYDYHDAVLTVTVEGQALFAQLTGQPKLRIFPRAADTFFWKVVDAQVVFLRDASGAVVAARHAQNGRVFTAPRLAEALAGPAPAQLDAFVGQYRYGPGMVLSVTREGDQLLAQLTGQPRFPIFPRSPTTFEWRVVEARVEFVMGEDGHVVKAVHTQNGTTFDAPRIE